MQRCSSETAVRVDRELVKLTPGHPFPQNAFELNLRADVPTEIVKEIGRHSPTQFFRPGVQAPPVSIEHSLDVRNQRGQRERDGPDVRTDTGKLLNSARVFWPMVVAVTALPFVRRTTLGADRAAWFAAMRGPRTGPDIPFSSLQTRMLACAQAHGDWELEKRAANILAVRGGSRCIRLWSGAHNGHPGQRRCSRR